jgi:hypothetical protein
MGIAFPSIFPGVLTIKDNFMTRPRSPGWHRAATRAVSDSFDTSAPEGTDAGIVGAAILNGVRAASQELEAVDTAQLAP